MTLFNKKKDHKPLGINEPHNRLEIVKNLSKPDNIYARTIIGILSVIVFVIIDYYCLYVIWNLVQTENQWYVRAIALACAISLDVPLAIAAISIKQYVQGIATKAEMLIIASLSIIVFLITFVCSFVFKVDTRSLSFEIGSAGTLTSNLAGSMSINTQPENHAVLMAGIFNGIIPLLTSISSFIISFFGYNPLETKINRLKNERICLQSSIMETEKALTEVKDADDVCRMLIARENDMFEQFIRDLTAQGEALKQLARVIMMEKLSTPESVTALSTSAKALAQETKIEVALGTELPELLADTYSQKTTETPRVLREVA